MGHSNNKLYNYLVNTFGISKKYVLELIDKRVQDLLNKHVHNKLNSNYIENLILNRVTRIVKEGFDNGGWYSRTEFDGYVKRVVRDILVKKLNDEYMLETKIVRKDQRLIKTFK